MKVTKLLLIPILIIAPLLNAACGSATTLNRVGSGFVQAAKGFKAEVASLRAAGLLTPEKLALLDKRADGVIVAADTLKTFLDGLPGITAGNKAEVLSKIGEASSLVAGLLQNPDLTGLPRGNLAVQILTFASITLQNAAVVVAAIQTPVSVKSAREKEQGIPTTAILVKTPKVPKGAEKYFQ